MDIPDRATGAAYIRSINVPANMSNCRQFVDYVADAAERGVNPYVGQELGQMLAHVTSALLEVINRLGAIDEHFREDGA